MTDQQQLAPAIKSRRAFPKWAYVLVVLIGPALFFCAIQAAFTAIGFVWDLLARFPYWWIVGAVVGYLIVGVVLLGCLLSSKDRGE